MLHIRSFVRRPAPRLPYRALAETVLGRRYELSLVFVGNARARALNRAYRKKETPANVLSFSLAPTDGEIFLNLEKTRDAATAQMLFIHALFHLKGFRHGSIMDAHEARVAKKFSHGSQHRYGN